MGYAQNAEVDAPLPGLESTGAVSPGSAGAISRGDASRDQRDVPSDWFRDPADTRSRQSMLDEAATAFLAAHEAGLLTDAAPRLLSEGLPNDLTRSAGTVVPLRPGSGGQRSDQAGESAATALASSEVAGPRENADSRENAGEPLWADSALPSGGDSIWSAFAPLADDGSGALAWQAEALCAQTDPEAFFPEKGGSTRDAKRVCASCSVRQDCLDYALENDERFGIWGGLSERERRRIRREGRLA